MASDSRDGIAPQVRLLNDEVEENQHCDSGENTATEDRLMKDKLTTA